MSYSRRAAHADPDGYGWYDAVRGRLAATVGDFFNHTEAFSGNKQSTRQPPEAAAEQERVVAVIAPHAGISYCGQTSAEAYAALWRYLYPAQPQAPGSLVRRFFVLGPSHHKGFEGVELSAATQYETPFGNLRVDTELVKSLKDSFKKAGVAAAFTSQRTDEEEHSIELQLPFLSYILHTPYAGPGPAPASTAPIAARISLVPMIVGWADRAGDETISQVLQPFMRDPQNVFVLSSDFCHWGSRFRYTYHYQREKYPQVGDSIIAMDHAAMELLEAKDLEGWYKYFKLTDNTICGRHPISVGLHWWTSKLNPQRDAVKVEFVSYSQSNKCKSEKDSSVSYASAVVREC